MITRQYLISRIETALQRSPVVTLIGPRQCGKTTIARRFLSEKSGNYFDLESPQSILRLQQPETALAELSGLVVIDEIQKMPELFPVLRVLVDRPEKKAQFLILGSAAPNIKRQAGESLAGRNETIEMQGFNILELQESGAPSLIEKHWLYGGFPSALLAENAENSFVWREQFIADILQRDLAYMAPNISATNMLRFWTMLSHYHGQVWNGAEIGSSMGISAHTVKSYLDILSELFMVRQLQPWHENLKKRQVKSPKIYFRDSGIFHALLGIKSQSDLLTNPKLGASWEGYVLEQVLQKLKPQQAYFWATHNHAELDLLLFRNGKRIGVEIKRQDAPKISKSIKIAMQDLKLDKMIIVYSGATRFVLEDNVIVTPLNEVDHDLP